MMKIVKIALTAVCFFGGSVASYGSCVEVPPGWDWNDTFYEAIDDVAGTSYIASPFHDANHYGIDLAGQNHCYTDGWRLYHKKISCSDYDLTDAECADFRVVSDSTMRPIFALYNINTGLLRTFINTEGFDMSDEQLVINYSVTKGNSIEEKTGILLNGKSPVVPLDDKLKDLNESGYDNIVVYPSLANKWAVVDIYVSYDPASFELDDDLQFTFNLSSINTSEVSLSGEFSFETNGTLSSHTSDSGSFGFSDLKKIGEAYSEPKEWAYSLEKAGNGLIQKDGKAAQELGSHLLSLSSVVSGVSGPLGYVNAGLTAYDTIFSVKSKSSKSYINTYSEGVLGVNGSISTTAPIEQLSLGVHGSNQSKSFDESDLIESGYDGRLGLLSISQRPKVVFSKVYSRDNSNYFNHNSYIPGSSDNYRLVNCGTEACYVNFDMISYSLLTDVEDIIKINPDSDMILKEYGIQPAFALEEEFINEENMENWNRYDYPEIDKEIASYSVAYTTPNQYSYIAECISKGKSISDCFYYKSSLSKLVKASDGQYSASGMYFPQSNQIRGDGITRGFSGPLSGVLIDKYYKFPISSPSTIPVPKLRWESSIDKFNLRLYVLLVHKDNPDVYVESYLTIPVQVGVCGESWRKYGALSTSDFNGYSDSDFFEPTIGECRRASRASFFKPKRWNEGTGRLMKQSIWYDEYNANRFCIEEGFDRALPISSTKGCGSDESEFSKYSSDTGWYGKESGSRDRCYSIYETIDCGYY